MGKRGKRVPKPRRVPSAGKHPRIAISPDHFEDARPVWRFSLMDVGGPWSCARLDAETFQRIIEKLKSYEAQSWKELQANRNNHCGAMPVAVLCSEAQNRLDEIRQHHDELFKLNLGGAARLWGIRDRGIFYVLWWDPDHTVYPMNIKDN